MERDKLINLLKDHDRLIVFKEMNCEGGGREFIMRG